MIELVERDKSAEESDIVLKCYEGLREELGDPFQLPEVDLSFPAWPPIQQPLDELLDDITTSLFGHFQDMGFFDRQRAIADTLHDLKKGAGVEPDHAQHAQGDGPVGVADSSGGGADVPRGSENGGAVGKKRKARKPQNAG